MIFFYNKLSRSIGSIWNKDMLYFELLFKIHETNPTEALILGNIYKLDKKYINIYEKFTFVENNSFKLSKYTFACLFVSNQCLLNWLGRIFCGKLTGKVYNWSIFKNVTRKKVCENFCWLEYGKKGGLKSYIIKGKIVSKKRDEAPLKFCTL